MAAVGTGWAQVGTATSTGHGMRAWAKPNPLLAPHELNTAESNWRGRDSRDSPCPPREVQQAGRGHGFHGRPEVPGPHLRGVEDADDAGDDGAVLVLVLLADELNVPQFAEVEIPLLLQPIHCQLQVHQLRRGKGPKPSAPNPTVHPSPPAGTPYLAEAFSRPQPCGAPQSPGKEPLPAG